MGTVAKNTAFMTIASIGQKIVAFAYFAFIARTLTVADTGKYTLALSFTTLFVVFIDLGLTNVFVRESARMKHELERYVKSILGVKFVLAFCTYLAMVASLRFFGYTKDVNLLIALSGITMIFDSVHLTCYGALRAIGDFRYEARSMVASQTLTLALGSTALLLHLPLYTLILALTIPSMLNALYASTVLRRTYHIHLTPTIDRPLMRSWWRLALPFALSAVFSRLYSYADTIMLSKMAGETAVGIYSIPTKLTYAFQFVPLALVAAVYPRLSEFFIKDKQAMSLLFGQSLKYLLVVVAPITAGIIALAAPVIVLVGGVKYLPSTEPLQILMIGLFFSFLSFPIGSCVNAANKQSTQTTIVACALITNLVLNTLLIPVYGVAGAALAAVMGNIMLTVLGYIVVGRTIHVGHLDIASFALRVCVSAGVMGIVVHTIGQYTHVVFAMVAGVIIYPFMLWLTRTVTMADIRQARMLIGR